MLQGLGKFAAVAVLACWAGCVEATGRHPAATAFATDFDCNERLVVREGELRGRYLVTGCEKRVVYQCVELDRLCSIQTVSDLAESRRAAREERRAVPFAEEPRMETKGGEGVLTLELPFDARSTLRIAASPKQYPDVVQVKLIRQGRGEDVDECNLSVMLNGQLLKLPKSNAELSGDAISHRVQLSGDTVGDLGAAEKLSVRICDERWALSPMQLERVHQFVDRFQEEVTVARGARRLA